MNRRSFHYLTSMGMAAALTKLTTIMSARLKPVKLSVGDKVGLIAPGSAIPTDRIERAVETSKKLGLVPILGDYVYEVNGYLSGTDTQRLADLHRMFGDQSIKAIWCIRGGYGCTRLLPSIDYRLIRKNPKILLGYSDITALHLAIQKECGLITYHGPVASSRPTDYTMNTLKEVLFKSEPGTIKLAETDSNPNTSSNYVIYNGQAEGALVGGNLSLLAALAGTRWCPSYAGKIVFIEDVGEKPYRIDRMLVQLFQSTDLREASGIILGQFNDCEAKPGENTLSLRETLQHQFSKLKVPVFYGFSFGHVDDNCTLPVGIRVRFNTDDKVLHILESSTEKVRVQSGE
ncbi:MAG: LD-carboxypeptidase [Saprospiraceae bacterium]|nr:LD-carboxypeptidase [Saprospiraceae bacterium]